MGGQLMKRVGVLGVLFLALTLLVAIGAFVIQGEWRLPNPNSKHSLSDPLLRSRIGLADADPPCVEGFIGQVRIELAGADTSVYEPQQSHICWDEIENEPAFGPIFREDTITTYCDGTTVVTEGQEDFCYCEAVTQQGVPLDKTGFVTDAEDFTYCTDPPKQSRTVCTEACPVPEDCCGQSTDCESCKGHPVSVSERGLAYEFRVFPLGQPGFPKDFSMFWSGAGTGLYGREGQPLGLRMSHPFTLYLWRMDTASTDYVRVRLEDGSGIRVTMRGSQRGRAYRARVDLHSRHQRN